MFGPSVLRTPGPGPLTPGGRAGAGPGLERERRQVRVVIPMALLGDLRRFVTGEPSAGSRMIVMLCGLMATVAGYLAGRTIL